MYAIRDTEGIEKLLRRFVMDKSWFKSAKFGMMIHWGLYSLYRRMGGQTMPLIAEWIQSYFQFQQTVPQTGKYSIDIIQS